MLRENIVNRYNATDETARTFSALDMTILMNEKTFQPLIDTKIRLVLAHRDFSKFFTIHPQIETF